MFRSLNRFRASRYEDEVNREATELGRKRGQPR